MKKGSFYLTGKAIDCSGLPALGGAGKEIFRALKVACNGVDDKNYGNFDSISNPVNRYLIIDNGVKLFSDESGLSYFKIKAIQPSDVLGQAAIDAALDGATIVFEGYELMPFGEKLLYWSDGSNSIHSPYPDCALIAYKLLDEKQQSIESLILAEKLGTGQPLVETAQPSTGWIKTISSPTLDTSFVNRDHPVFDHSSKIKSKILAEKVGTKHDAGKQLYNLIPAHAEAEFVDVLTFGATKYALNQWRNVENATERYTAAAMRHLAAYRMGETNDNESGKHHLAHAMCCLAFIIELDLEENK